MPIGDRKFVEAARAAYQELQDGAEAPSLTFRDYLRDSLWESAMWVRVNGDILMGHWPPGGSSAFENGMPLPEWYVDAEIVYRGMRNVARLDRAAARSLAKARRRRHDRGWTPMDSGLYRRGKELFFSVVIEDADLTFAENRE